MKLAQLQEAKYHQQFHSNDDNLYRNTMNDKIFRVVGRDGVLMMLQDIHSGDEYDVPLYKWNQLYRKIKT